LTRTGGTARRSWLPALRHRLPRAIQIVSVREAASDFHARFSASGKIYEYRIHLGDADPFTRPYAWALLKPVDVAAMRAAAAVLVGRHDFKAFSALNGAEGARRPIRSETCAHWRS
jgi:tRNA pseudouridine38-40 synthase